MLLGGQQRLDKIGQRIVQLVADLNAQHLRLIAARRVLAVLNGRIHAEYAKIDRQFAALDIHAELLAEQMRVAEEALQPLASSKMSEDAAPSDCGMIDSPSPMQGGAKAVMAGSEATRVDEPSGAPVSEGGMHTLNVTTTDTVAVDSIGPRHEPGLTAHDHDTNVPLACGWGACTNESSGTGMPSCSDKVVSFGGAITRTHRPNGSFVVRHATSIFRIAEEAACGLVTSVCKSTSTASAHLYRFRTRRPARATTASSPNEAHWRQKQTQSYVRYSALHMARL